MAIPLHGCRPSQMTSSVPSPSNISTAALDVLGRDFAFPHSIDGLPQTLSEVTGLSINSYQTNDGVTLQYWEAGSGPPIIFIPGWGAHGAMYINLMYLLRSQYKVIVLDQRNHGLSDKVSHGIRIARHAMDVRNLLEYLRLESATLCGWSMGCSVSYAYIDLFGTSTISRLILIDQAPSIYNHSDWCEEERVNAGAFTTSAERMVAMFSGTAESNTGILQSDPRPLYKNKTPAFENSESFAREFVKRDVKAEGRVLYDHVVNDWRDVIEHKINVPTAIFSGNLSGWVHSQRWMQSVIEGSKLYIYSEEEQGDHFLHLKNPRRFVEDLVAFLQE